ncbi:MAG: flagellar motor switch protein FliM [Actinobacteria bacterium]|nr:flagellar motor switch protein FliM [Actinomycetota bacterium]
MTGTLTQDEINALLSTTSGGGLTGTEEGPAITSMGIKHVRTYNFRHPNRFSKSHLSAMKVVYEGFLCHLKAALLIYMRKSVSFSLVSIEQKSFEEYIEALPTPSSLITFTMKGLPGSAILEISSELTFLILDRLLGGAGDRPTKARDLTEIECGIVRRVAERVLTAFKVAWSEIYSVEPSIEALDTDSELLRGISPDEIVAVTTLEVRLGKAIGILRTCLPYLMLEPIMSKLTRQTWLFAGFEHRGSDKPESGKVKEALNQVRLPVSIELGRAKISINDLLQLKPGDSVRLDTPADYDIRVLVNGRVKFYGQLGVIGRRLAVKTTGVAD